MSIRAQHSRRQAAQQMRLHPVWITLRRLTRADGPYPAQNPPRVQGSLALAGAHQAGDTIVAVRATRLQGRIIVGDIIAIGTSKHTATIAATDTGTNMIAVTISPPLAAPAADGAAVSATWLGEKRLPCRQQDFGLRMTDGEKIIAGDQKITVAAIDLSFEPKAEDQVILPDGKLLTVVNVFPSRIDGQAILWDLHTR